MSSDRKPALALCERPGIIHRIVAPLPLQFQFILREIVAIHESLAVVAQHRLLHLGRNIALLIGQHRPSVLPGTWLQREHSAHTTTWSWNTMPYQLPSLSSTIVPCPTPLNPANLFPESPSFRKDPLSYQHDNKPHDEDVPVATKSSGDNTCRCA